MGSSARRPWTDIITSFLSSTLTHQVKLRLASRKQKARFGVYDIHDAQILESHLLGKVSVVLKDLCVGTGKCVIYLHCAVSVPVLSDTHDSISRATNML